ncbi:MAG: mannose-1-phosphate guanylyltransferase/mannose-6-phosphate isomerase [Gallionella sp.]|nr:mannose-1-phosphate guanylyltransferase/mannose-6-phosphate isomerase [Gallionella sp.]
MKENEIFAVILAGGTGSRLWPLSRQNLPKQFLTLDGHASLLQTTINRLAPVIVAKNVLIVTQESHAKGEAYHALQPYPSLFEPVGRNTAPAIALAAARLMLDGSDPIMVVLPADHVIKDEITFRTHLNIAIEAAKQDKLVTFGIQPTRPDTGFGYIKTSIPSSVLDPQSCIEPQSCVLAVERFTEKPDLATAEQFLKEGNYFWNSGMFVWRASVILAEIEQHLPDVYQVIQAIIAESRVSGDFQGAVVKYFAGMPSVSIDYGVLEKSSRVSLIPCDIGWNDVGSWQAVHDISAKDENGNALQGNVIAVDCKNSLIRAEKRLVAVIGVEDLCVVETADAILISKNDQTQRVREVVDVLQDRGASEHVCHTKVNRPWGSFTVLEGAQDGFKLKRIVVSPGSKLSLQSHAHRSEHWVVVSGTATVTNGDEIITVNKNQSTYIPMGTKHRLENRGKIPLNIVEIQVGEYLGEDDIQRYEDHYGR